MDSSAWIHHGNSSSSVSVCSAAAAAPWVDSPAAGLRFMDQEEVLVREQIQHHLNQISMHMNMDDEPVYGNGAAVGMQSSDVGFDFLPSHHASSFRSSSSSSFASASLSCSPESSLHLLTPAGRPTTAGAGCLHYTEVSSHVALAEPVVLPFIDDVSFDDMTAMVPTAAPGMSTSAFRRYSRHLGPRRRTKPGGASAGQRMFKTAMSVLAKMHTAMRYKQQYSSYQQVSADDGAEPPSSVNQLQHMISERKRREKLNDSFHSLKAVLPPGPKKDKTSILITAREYVTSLKSKLYELKEKNQALESRLARRAAADAGGASDDDDDEDDAEADEKVEIEITRSAAAAAAAEPRETCTVKIALRPACGNTTDVVLRTLQYLKDEVGHDVSLLAMSTTDGASTADGRASLTLQLQSVSGAKWEDAAVKEAVTKAVAEALPSQSSTAVAGDRPRRSAKRLKN